jgi:hypothetical protein
MFAIITEMERKFSSMVVSMLFQCIPMMIFNWEVARICGGWGVGTIFFSSCRYRTSWWVQTFQPLELKVALRWEEVLCQYYLGCSMWYGGKGYKQNLLLVAYIVFQQVFLCKFARLCLLPVRHRKLEKIFLDSVIASCCVKLKVELMEMLDLMSLWKMTIYWRSVNITNVLIFLNSLFWWLFFIWYIFVFILRFQSACSGGRKVLFYTLRARQWCCMQLCLVGEDCIFVYAAVAGEDWWWTLVSYPNIHAICWYGRFHVTWWDCVPEAMHLEAADFCVRFIRAPLSSVAAMNCQHLWHEIFFWCILRKLCTGISPSPVNFMFIKFYSFFFRLHRMSCVKKYFCSERAKINLKFV